MPFLFEIFLSAVKVIVISRFLRQLFRYLLHYIVSFASCEEVEEVHAVYLLQAVQVSCNFVYLL